MLRNGGIQDIGDFEHIGFGCIVCCWICCILPHMTHVQLASWSQSTGIEFLAVP